MSEERTYYYSPGSYYGDARGVGMSVEDTNPNATVEDLRKDWDSNKALQQAFGSFDNYMAYMDERQDLIDAGELDPEWWTLTREELITGERGGALEDITEGADIPEPEYDFSGVASQALGDGLISDIQGGFEESAFGGQDADAFFGSVGVGNYGAMQEREAELFNKYSTQPMEFTDEKGNEFTWNGTSYVKTYYADTSTSIGEYFAALAPSLVLGMAGAAVAGPLSASISSSTGLGATASKAIANALVNAVSQYATTGEVDPKQLLSNYLTQNIGEWAATDIFKGTPLESVANAYQAQNIGGAAVRGAIDSAVNQIITDGNIDLTTLLTDTAIQVGYETLADFVQDAGQTRNETLLSEEGTLNGIPIADLSPEQIMELSNTTDLYGLLGENGLLAKLGFEVGYMPTDYVGDLIDFALGGAEINYAVGPDGTKYPVIESNQGAGILTEDGFISVNDILSGTAEGFDEIFTESGYGILDIMPFTDATRYDERFFDLTSERGDSSQMSGIWEQHPFAVATGMSATQARTFVENAIGEGSLPSDALSWTGVEWSDFLSTDEGQQAVLPASEDNLLEDADTSTEVQDSEDLDLLADTTVDDSVIDDTTVDDSVIDDTVIDSSTIDSTTIAQDVVDETSDIDANITVDDSTNIESSVSTEMDDSYDVVGGDTSLFGGDTTVTTGDQYDVVGDEYDVVGGDTSLFGDGITTTTSGGYDVVGGDTDLFGNGTTTVNYDSVGQDTELAGDSTNTAVSTENNTFPPEEQVLPTQEDNIIIYEEEEEDLPSSGVLDDDAFLPQRPQGMMSSRPFEKFMTGISYQVPTIQQIVQNPQIDYTASLNDLINRNSGMFG